ncbi:MAG: hypothetical protein ACI8V2_002859, partial [Candidatus Latescibacterota bacterium]
PPKPHLPVTWAEDVLAPAANKATASINILNIFNGLPPFALAKLTTFGIVLRKNRSQIQCFRTTSLKNKAIKKLKMNTAKHK